MSQDLCSICHTNPFKYKCPACGIRTCSASCVSRHKLQTECTGLVDSTKFIPKKQLNNNDVNRDYNFLLGMDRRINLGKSDIKTNAKGVFKRHFNQPSQNKRQKMNPNTTQIIDSKIQKLLDIFPDSTKTDRKGVTVIQMPAGMQRSIQNKTGYDKKQQCFVWTIEWVILDLDGKEFHKFTSFRVQENLKLVDAFPFKFIESLLLKVAENPDNSEYKEVTSEHLVFYMRDLLSMQKKIYMHLDSQQTVSALLKDKLVLEFPTIYIALSEKILSGHSVKSLSVSDSDSEDDSSSSDSSDESSSEDDSSGGESSDDEVPEESSSKVVVSSVPNIEETDKAEQNTSEEVAAAVEVTQEQQ